MSLPVPYTSKRKQYNPERKTFRGRSYRKGLKRVRELRYAQVTE